MGFMGKEVVKRIPAESSSGKTYEICEYNDGSFSCNCPAWIFHKGTRVDCKHIQEYQLVIQNLKVVEEKKEVVDNG